jgi:hypothetical protein
MVHGHVGEQVEDGNDDIADKSDWVGVSPRFHVYGYSYHEFEHFIGPIYAITDLNQWTMSPRCLLHPKQFADVPIPFVSVAQTLPNLTRFSGELPNSEVERAGFYGVHHAS